MCFVGCSVSTEGDRPGLRLGAHRAPYEASIAPACASVLTEHPTKHRSPRLAPRCSQSTLRGCTRRSRLVFYLRSGASESQRSLLSDRTSMPNYRRYRVPGGTCFFTVVTQGRARILTATEARASLHAAISECRRRWPFRIDGIVLLPEHIHAIWSLPR